MRDLVELLTGPPPVVADPPPYLVVEAAPEDARLRRAHAALRRDAFVHRQGLFDRSDADDHDADPRTRVLVAVARDGAVVGGVRLHPAAPGADIGWWRGSRLVAADCGGSAATSVCAALVRAACAVAEREGVLRFDAHVQPRVARLFTRLGWETVRPMTAAGAPHVLMRFPIDRIAAHAAACKSPLGDLLTGVARPGAFLGDDGAPVPGSDVVACVDAILPAMVERDPEWAGWCGVLVTAHDLSAMGARPAGLMDALAARDRATARRVIDGLRRGSAAFELPILGGHTQLGAAAALSVTGLGRVERPVPAGAARPGDRVLVTADLDGGWRPGYHGRQWDSTSWRRSEDLRAMLRAVPDARPRAAKDVSMAGLVGTAGMMAEAAGAGMELEVAAIPRPASALMGDWLTCFPGFAMIAADPPGAPPLAAGPAVTAVCGRVEGTPGVRLRWPDGDVTTALAGGVTGLGPSTGGDPWPS